MNEVRVIKPGFYTSIQDLGRRGFSHYGVPVSGVMDSLSAARANLLLNNSKNAAVLEITMTGPELHFKEATQICICGAEFEVYLDNKPISNAKAYYVSKNAILSFKALKKGFRAYLAVWGGFKSKKVLGSCSFYAGITNTSRLQKDDLLLLSAATSKDSAGARVVVDSEQLFSKEIPVYKGPEFDLLPQALQGRLFTIDYTLTPAGNRMAIPFKERLPNTLKGILTGPVLPGTIQLTPGGSLIALMRDCQVTGGYPRVLQIQEIGLCRLSQKTPGMGVRFTLTSA
ncbi:biotin-dependent carboxyltransferase family protein [Leeuwenhoekiella sp. MAR_2009_132]|uniref:5-oxoprolinase subunit C family protein n=1 Tax=Leeuwenhoekiella sp. MAR_2009_132 TaxID=1392489 RepID=UPI00048D5C70|nr:biotin-dependent carboxyltransferase family protein [Leeuwenhoekiella sp. MAR_2009_132]